MTVGLRRKILTMLPVSSRFLPAWLLSIPLSYFVLGFLSNYYPTYFEITLLTLLIHSGVSIFFYFLLKKVHGYFQSQPVDLGMAIALFIILSFFLVTMFRKVEQFPSLFDAAFFQLEKYQLIFFSISIILALPLFAWTLFIARKKRLDQTRFFYFIDKNLPGLILAAFFFGIYLIFASIFNQPAFDVDDIFFDTDGLLWRTRFTTVDYRDYYWRSVHPFVLLIIRPLVALFSLFLKGDRLTGAFVLAAFAGALCVFLAWYFTKRTIGGTLYALLIASLLGASAAQLVFGSLIETYIFLAAVAMVFMVLLLEDKSIFLLILTGALSFGITITNFIQTVIAFIFVKRNFKQWVTYGVVVGLLVIPLTLLNNFVYPESQPYFFNPSSFTAETGNTFTPSIGRGLAALRVMFLHSMVAPDPLILEEEIPFLKVWIFKAEPMRLSEYETWFGTTVALFWVVLLSFGGILFLKNLKKADNRFTFSFVLILLFNFALHLRYGKDLFLYSTNWIYAIILFLALAWKDVANKRWFQVGLLVFIALLLANNSRLILTMLSTSSLHIK